MKWILYKEEQRKKIMKRKKKKIKKRWRGSVIVIANSSTDTNNSSWWSRGETVREARGVACKWRASWVARSLSTHNASFSFSCCQEWTRFPEMAVGYGTVTGCARGLCNCSNFLVNSPGFLFTFTFCLPNFGPSLLQNFHF